MRKAIIAAIVAGALLIPEAAPAADHRRDPEGCAAVNPGMPTCTITITTAPTLGQATGAAGPGNWEVTIVRTITKGKKKKKTTFKLTPDAMGVAGFDYLPGDVVTATALDPGSFVVAGHD
ncbi:MAG: hypothetical protein ACRDH6_00920 [Actinomycetota bacterium]